MKNITLPKQTDGDEFKSVHISYDLGFKPNLPMTEKSRLDDTQPEPGSVVEQELACSVCGYKHTYNKALVTPVFLQNLYCLNCHKRTPHEIPKQEEKK